MRRACRAVLALAIVGLVVAGGMTGANALSTEPRPGVMLALTPAANSGLAVSGSYVAADGRRRGIARLTPRLRVLTSGSQVVTRGYCIELSYPIVAGSTYRETDWTSYRAFAADPARARRVVGILESGYPESSLTALRDATGERALTQAEAITATQVAIWGVSDRFLLADLPGASTGSEARVRTVVTYLLNRPARPAPGPPRVAISGPASGEGGSRLGPFRVTASQSPVTVDLRGSTQARLVLGNQVLASRRVTVRTGTELFVQVPPAAGAAELTASVTPVAVPVGRVFTHQGASGQRRQSLISVGSPAARPLTATRGVRWTADVPVMVSTSVADVPDGDRVVSAEGGEVIDTVSLSGLDRGMSYEVRGQLVVNNGGTAVPIGQPVVVPLVAEGREASVDVRLPVSRELVGQHVVVFEQVRRNGVLVARHEDLHAESQTFVVELPPPPPPLTPTETATPSPSSSPHTTSSLPVTPPSTTTTTASATSTASTTPTPSPTTPPAATSPAASSPAASSPEPSTSSPSRTAPTRTVVVDEPAPVVPTHPRSEPSPTATQLAQTGSMTHHTWPLAAGLLLLGAGSIVLARPRHTPTQAVRRH